MWLLSDGKGRTDSHSNFWTSDGVKAKKKGSKVDNGFWTSDNSLLVETDPEEAKRVDRQSSNRPLKSQFLDTSRSVSFL